MDEHGLRGGRTGALHRASPGLGGPEENRHPPGNIGNPFLINYLSIYISFYLSIYLFLYEFIYLYIPLLSTYFFSILI